MKLHLFCFPWAHGFVLTTSLPLLHCLLSVAGRLTSLICIKTECATSVCVWVCVSQSPVRRAPKKKELDNWPGCWDNDCVTIFVTPSSEILRTVKIETKVICMSYILKLELRLIFCDCAFHGWNKSVSVCCRFILWIWFCDAFTGKHELCCFVNQFIAPYKWVCL